MISTFRRYKAWFWKRTIVFWAHFFRSLSSLRKPNNPNTIPVWDQSHFEGYLSPSNLSARVAKNERFQYILLMVVPCVSQLVHWETLSFLSSKTSTIDKAFKYVSACRQNTNPCICRLDSRKAAIFFSFFQPIGKHHHKRKGHTASNFWQQSIRYIEADYTFMRKISSTSFCLTVNDRLWLPNPLAVYKRSKSQFREDTNDTM